MSASVEDDSSLEDIELDGGSFHAASAVSTLRAQSARTGRRAEEGILGW